MNDIVGRLRTADDLCLEAADKIEKLEAALAPFARLIDLYDAPGTAEEVGSWDNFIKQIAVVSEADCRAAKAAMH